MNKKSTRRALLTSIVSLVLCCTMLIGTTFAWFTDTVTSAGNKIQAGNLDIELYMWNSKTSSEKISERTEPIFGTGALATNSTNTLWEPGKTQTVYFSLKNEGSLDLKYKVELEVENTAKNLFEVMQYAITPDAKFGEVEEWTTGTNVNVGTNATSANDVALEAGGEHFFALSVHMDEEATNKYMNGEVTFDIHVLAGQLSSEEDSFDETYDKNAVYPGAGYAPIPEPGVSAVEIPVNAINDNGVEEKIGTVVVPAAAIADDATGLNVNIKKTEYAGNITVADDETKVSYDVTVKGLKEGNTTPVKAQLRIPTGLDPATVKLYHYDVEIPCSYEPSTGLVTFNSTEFSPFTVVYEPDSEYVPPMVDNNTETPQAIVERATEYENVILDWGSYGQWSPTEGLEANLEAAYKFSCPKNAIESDYVDWYCDFYVKLDRALGENQIFLGGNYGSFGWVGFHNGDLTLEANTEIGLLESVTTNPWTFRDVINNVGTFTCGVGDVNNALKGAKFTVTLRLTNPDPTAEIKCVDAAEITYTFE